MEQLFYASTPEFRFFLLHKAQELPTGNFMVYKLDGQRLGVAEHAIRSFEISKEAARMLIQQQLKESMHRTQAHMQEAVAFTRLFDSEIETKQALLEQYTLFIKQLHSQAAILRKGIEAEEEAGDFAESFQEFIESPEVEEFVDTIKEGIKDLGEQLKQLDFGKLFDPFQANNKKDDEDGKS